MRYGVSLQEAKLATKPTAYKAGHFRATPSIAVVADAVMHKQEPPLGTNGTEGQNEEEEAEEEKGRERKPLSSCQIFYDRTWTARALDIGLICN